MLKIRSKKVIIATGSIERPLIFDNNDRPGILLASAIKKYADLYGVACGENIILLTNNDSAYETASSLIQKGIKIKSVIDIREKIDPKLLYEMKKNNVKVYLGSTIVNTFGYKRISTTIQIEIATKSRIFVVTKRNIIKLHHQNSHFLAFPTTYTLPIYFRNVLTGQVFNDNQYGTNPQYFSKNQKGISWLVFE